MTEPHGLMYWSTTSGTSFNDNDVLKAPGSQTIGENVQDFDVPDNFLRYTGICTRTFLVTAMLSVTADEAGADISIFIAKEGSTIASSEACVTIPADGDDLGDPPAYTPGKVIMCTQAHVTLAQNETVGIFLALNSSSGGSATLTAGPGTLSAWPLPEDD